MFCLNPNRQQPSANLTSSIMQCQNGNALTMFTQTTLYKRRMPEIIRKGDSTSHGGTVLEGSPTDICMGKPISFIGHKVHCPKCRGDFPIVEGVMTATFYGKGVAVAGMKTSCGAKLIASQFTDTVDWSSGASGTGAARQ